jgi:hypothetical protein
MLEGRTVSEHWQVVNTNPSIARKVKALHEPIDHCADCGGKVFVMHKLRELLCFDLYEQGSILDPSVDMGEKGFYRLAGVIYYRDFHFISRVITKGGKMYTHDGMHGTSSVYDGMLDNEYDLKWLNTCNGRAASIAVYWWL